MVPQELENFIALRLCQLVDPFCESPIHKQPFPPSNGIGPNDRMNSLQVLSDVLRRSPVFSEFRSALLGDIDKVLSNVCSSEALEESLISRGKTVVGFVGTGPEGVTAYFGKFSYDK